MRVFINRGVTAAAASYSYRDINLLFTPNPISRDIATLQDTDAVTASIINLIQTRHYERPFHPEIGCNVASLLFDNVTPITAISIKKSILDVIANFEPRATISAVDVIANPDANRYDVTIRYYCNNVSNLVTVNTFLERVR